MDPAAPTNPVPEPDDATEENRVRSGAYALLAALMAAPPKRELLEQVAAIDASGSEPDSRFGPAWRSLREAALAATPGELDDEYHALFIGLGRGELMPYGSWYVTGFMMDKPLAVLRRDLAQLGFQRSDRVFETEDHACALLEVMAMLITEAQGLGSQRLFFSQHIEPWMGSFFRDLRDAKSASFYRAVGEFGTRFMDFEREYLAMLR